MERKLKMTDKEFDDLKKEIDKLTKILAKLQELYMQETGKRRWVF